MSEKPKKILDPNNPDPRKDAESMLTVEGPVSPAPPKQPSSSANSGKSSPPPKQQVSSVAPARPGSDPSETLNSAVALKTPTTTPSSSNETIPVFDNGVTVFGGSFDTHSGLSSGGSDSSDFIGPYRLVKLLGEG